MKPPICELCGIRFDPATNDGLVKFADYQPLPPGMVGHPKGLFWFCERHYDAAQALANNASEGALTRLRRNYWLRGWLRQLSR